MDTLQTITLGFPDPDALARSRILFLDSLKEGIYQIDENGLCVFMNRPASDMLGYAFDEALGQRIRELHHACDCASRADGHESGHLDRREILRRRDGTPFPVESTFHPLMQDGAYRGAVITFSDITARLKHEQRLQLQWDISRILGSAASLEEAAPKILKSLCETLNMDGAWLWEIERVGGKPSLIDTWHPSLGESPPIEPNPDLALKVAASGAPLWIEDEGQNTSAAEHVFRSGFAIPLCQGDRVIGAMHFISRRVAAEDADILHMMMPLGDAIAQFVERRRAEEARGQLIAILEATTNLVGLAIDTEGKILSVNRAVEQIFGYVPEDLLESSLALLIPEYQRHWRESGWIFEKEAGFNNEELPRRIRANGVHKSGRTIPLELSLGECAMKGRRVFTLIIADTTDRDAAKEALLNQTRLVQLIVSSMGEGVIVADENFDLLMVNPAAKRLIPPVRAIKSLLEAEPILGGPEPLAYGPDGVTRCGFDELPLVRAIRGESIDNAEILLRAPNRQQGTWVNETSRPLLDSTGRLCGGVVISRDITEQKASADALRGAKDEAEFANRAKSEFLSRMSHELRTPMNAILGFAQLLELDPLTEEQMDGVTRMLRAGRHLLALINEILDLSRIEAGRLNLELGVVNLYEVMQAAIELVRPLMEQRNIQLIEPPTSDRRWYVDGDSQRLTQVFLNLLSNAAKYNREGGSVTISFSRYASAASDRLRIRITDTGPGMADEDLKKLFVPFERLTADRTSVEGTGLGLALSKRLIHLMNGTIGVKSKLGEGSTFWVDLTLCTEQAEAPRVPVGLEDTEDDANLISILYIEDDIASVKPVETMLSRIPGFRLISANTGQLGLEMARRYMPELILLSVTLPDLSGLDFLHQAQQNERTRSIPVVVVSADSSEQNRDELLESGARAYITMPVNVLGLLDVITEVISCKVSA